ncbi:MAG: nuclear transport factor 2 family protein [Terriglobia bacterium]
MPQSSPARRSGHQKDSTAAGPLAAIEKLTDAWMRKDLRGMSRQLSDDITELGPAFAKPLTGKRDFFEKYEAYLSGPLRIESYRMLRPRLTHLTPWLVLVHFRYRMTTENQGKVEKVAGQESMLVELRRGRWRVKFIHWHRV